MADISGREVDFRKIQEIADEDGAYDRNYVKVDTDDLSDADIKSLENGNGGYVRMVSSTRAKAMRYARLAMAYKKKADEEDVKDDEGRHSDGEFMHIDKHGDEWLVHVDKEPEQKFDSLHEALDYVMTMHGDERFEKDEEDDKEDEEEAKRAELMAAYKAKKAKAINASRALAPRIAPASSNDPCADGLYR